MTAILREEAACAKAVARHARLAGYGLLPAP
jgi:hypothetical protein